MLTGARQVGKSTLAQALISPDWPAAYLTLDERPVLDAALKDPDGLLAGAARPLVLDEVQRAPDLLRAVKLAIDRDRRNGSFLLTGSAHLGTLRTVSESLAGRVAVYELHPFSWAELRGTAPPTTLRDLFAARDARELLELWRGRPVPPDQLAEIRRLILRGGYPVPALMEDDQARERWFASYRQTYLERDVRDLADLERMPEFNRLLALVALRTGQLLNMADLARDARLPHSTVRRYLALLEQTYQVFLLQPYFVHARKRLVRTPKVYLTDTGLACHLVAAERWETLERQGRAGAMVETWAAAELRKLLAAAGPFCRLYFWRTHAGQEVDFLLERGEECVAVEVKLAVRLDPASLAGLRACREALGPRLRLAVVLYAGTSLVPLEAATLAVPFAAFFLGLDGDGTAR